MLHIKLLNEPGYQEPELSMLELVSRMESKTNFKMYMASNVYNNFLQKLLAAYLVTGADIRAIMCMTNTTADTVKDAMNFVSNLTLDEADATGYARVALGSEASNVDDANDRAEFDSNDISYTSLSGDASRAYQGVVLIKFVTNDADSVPIAFVEFPTTVPATATQVDVTVNAEGWLQAAQG